MTDMTRMYDHPTFIAAPHPEDMYYHRDEKQCSATDDGQVCTLVEAHASPDHLSYDSQGVLRHGWPT